MNSQLIREMVAMGQQLFGDEFLLSKKQAQNYQRDPYSTVRAGAAERKPH